MSNERTQALSNVGVSIWLDDLSRTRIESGQLAELAETVNVVGVTTNPTIFQNAIGSGVGYADRIADCAKRGLDAAATITELTTADVADACDIFAGVFAATDGRDGRVSIEVEPGLARDAAGTVAQAKELWAKVDRENAMIKIPATIEGLAAISEVIAAGISVNVTLIFSLERYRQVINAYLVGLERRAPPGSTSRRSTRSPRSSCRVSTRRSTRASRPLALTRRARSRARLASRMRASRTRCSSSRSPATAQECSSSSAHTRSARCGRRRV